MAASTCILNFVKCLIILFFVNVSLALYADQVGKFDWNQKLIGKVKYALFDHSTHSSKRIVVATEENVIAALNSKTGAILWRHVFEKTSVGIVHALYNVGNDVVTLTGGGNIIRSWNSATGVLHWESVASKSTATDNPQSLLMLEKKTLVVLTSDTVFAVGLATGKIKWTAEVPNKDTVVYKHFYTDLDNLYLIGTVEGSHVTIATISLETGKVKLQTQVPASWVLLSTTCKMLQSGRLICFEPRMKYLYSLQPPSGDQFVPTALSDVMGQLMVIKDVSFTDLHADSVGVQVAPDHHIVITVDASGQAKLVKDLPQTLVISAATTPEATALLALSRPSAETVRVMVYNMDSSFRVEADDTIRVPSHHGNPETLFSYVFGKKESSFGYRALMISEDDSAVLLSQAGDITWAKEEALASIVSVEMADLPVSEIQAKFEEEFGAEHEDVLTMFGRRITTQVSEMRLYVTETLERTYGGGRLTALEKQKRELVRDDFNIHKIIVAVTASGKVFGIDNLSGEVIWQKLIPGIVPFQQLGKETLPLFVLRTTAHFPHPPEYAVLGKHKATGNGLLDVFNPITGRCMTREVIQLNYRVQHASQLAQHDADFVRPVIFVDTNKLIHVYPETATDVLMEAVAHNYLFSADADTGVVTGYRMSLTAEKGFTSEPVWSVILSKDTQRITNVVAKRQNEHVHSQGRVLGDRSVLYKYLNPNLVVFTTEGQDDQEKSYVTLYLIDVISGQVVFSANHQRAKGPVNIVHSENWVVYTYWNQRLRRHEVAALEMYEGRTQSNTTAFSSLAPPPTPIVERQAYILPYTVVAMTTTITEKGITNRHILLALADGGILDLPKALLDPRRPNTPTAEHRPDVLPTINPLKLIFNKMASKSVSRYPFLPRIPTEEEGLIPYMPEIGAPKEMIINYNRSVFNIDAIYSAPAGLESTTLIFAYGLDLFCTRVWPSKMFDVLKDDFDYWLISVVLTALILSSIILQKMAARKQLHAAWK